jgi:hypothetical protein
MVSCDLARIIRGAIVDDKTLPVWIRLGLDALECLTDEAGVVVGRYDDADTWRGRHARSPLPLRLQHGHDSGIAAETFELE